MELIKAPNEFLEKQVKPFDFEKMDAGQISNDMVETMLKYKGIGLASNQVGIDAQIFVMGEEKPITVINPIITEVGPERVEMEEGCLSYPDVFLKVKRPDKIVVKYEDENKKIHKMKLSGLASRVFQHEYDHMEGIDFTQRS